MRLLTLVRHAKSSWDDPDVPDFDRPLNARGERDAPVMARRLAKAPPPPDLLVSSPALRAIATAQAFAGAFGIAPSEIETNESIYEAEPPTLLQVVRRLPREVRHAMLIGHNPGISQAARLLAECPFEEMPTCAAVRLEFAVGKWSDVKPGCGKVLRYDYPKQGRNDFK